MYSKLTMPLLAVLVATAMAQSTSPQSTSAPSTAATKTTKTAPYDYCTSTSTAGLSTATPDENEVISPIPCSGLYTVQAGFCCQGGSLNVTCEESDCECPGSDEWWQLPLDDCVENNPLWSGCPGNMLKGLCCSGPGIGVGLADSSPDCLDGGTPVFTVRTANGTASTSTFPPSSTTGVSITSAATLLTTSTSPGAAGRTAAPGDAWLAAIALGGVAGLVAAF